jgi:hypothetical protein
MSLKVYFRFPGFEAPRWKSAAADFQPTGNIEVHPVNPV